MAAKRGRQPGITLTEEHRAKISKSNILNRLISHASGKVAMTSTEVTAAVCLLKKVIPDLAAVQHSGEIAMPYALVLPMAASAEEWESECAAPEAKDIH